MAAKRPLKTPNDGANVERSATLAYVRRLKRRMTFNWTAELALETIENWLKERAARYNAKPFGLGRK